MEMGRWSEPCVEAVVQCITVSSKEVDRKARSTVLEVPWASEKKVGVPFGTHCVRSYVAASWMSDSVFERSLRWGWRSPDHREWCLLKSPINRKWDEGGRC